MKRDALIVLTVVVALLAVLGLNPAVFAGRTAEPAAPLAGAPTVVSYQGHVTVAGIAYSGPGYFKFAVADQPACTTSYWMNDGSPASCTAPSAAVSLTVSNGLFNVLLGDTSITNMTALPASVFSGTTRYLRVWFSSDNVTFTHLTPDRRIAAVPYALQATNADLLDGQESSAFQQKYNNVVVVAKSGGDYTTIGATLAAISASAADRYLIWVAPGTYTESVTMEPYVDIQGAGEVVTKITYGGSGTWNLGTVIGADNAELRFLTVENTGGNTYAVAIYNGSASPRITHVTCVASGGTTTTYGVRNITGSPVMTNVSVSVSGSATGIGIYNGTSSAPELTHVTVSASDASNNYGIWSETPPRRPCRT